MSSCAENTETPYRTSRRSPTVTSYASPDSAASVCMTFVISWPPPCWPAASPVVTVSERLGHARASTTLNVYAHSIPGADRDAADIVARLLRDPLAQSSVMS